MKRATLLTLALSLLSSAAIAEDSVRMVGNYYKERSTRVVSPVVLVEKDLPGDTQLEAGYLVDQITSASGAFTKTDQPFQEYRHDVRAAAHTRLGPLSPGASLRYSTESDYSSAAYGLSLGLSLFHDLSTLQSFFQYRHDVAGIRGRASFQMPLDAYIFGVGWTQVLSRSSLCGVSLELQRLRGYQENPYRVENHPRARDRRALSFFAATHLDDTRTTLRAEYRFYTDSWEVVGHTLDLEITQALSTDVSIAPRFRIYSQSAAFFVTITPEGYLTNDPKLRAFSSYYYGLGLVWRQSWLRGSFLEPFAGSRVEPSYAYLDQKNAYGPAHIVELGWYWPF